jgi:hypothetical protein
MDVKPRTEAENLVSFVRGDMPVLLTAPHGGTEQPGDIDSTRSASKGYKPRATEIFSNLNDEDTLNLVFRLAEEIRRKIGKSPYVVAANFDRRYVDVNRNSNLLGPAGVPYENHAYDDPAGRKYYETYHGKIREYVDEIGDRFKSGGLLFDFHSSVLQDKRIVVGMVTYDPADFQRYFRRGHVSVDQLIHRFGFEPLYHPLSGFISALHGHRLPGGITSEVLPVDRFRRASPSGGYTVITYGSNRPGGIDAFQMECSMKLCSQWLGHTVEIYSDAIQCLYRTVIEEPYCTEIVFAGKKKLGNHNNHPKIVTVPFALRRAPRKNYPAVIMVHGRRVSGKHITVTLNGVFLGKLRPEKSVSLFDLQGKTLAAFRKNHNELIIAASPMEQEDEDAAPADCDVVKVSVTYCSR